MEDENLKKVLRFFKKEKLNEEEEYYKTVYEFEIEHYQITSDNKSIQFLFKDNVKIPDESKYDEVDYIETIGNDSDRIIDFEKMVNNSWVDDERVYKKNETIHLNIDRDIFETRIRLYGVNFGLKRSGYKFTVKINFLEYLTKTKNNNTISYVTR